MILFFHKHFFWSHSSPLRLYCRSTTFLVYYMSSIFFSNWLSYWRSKLIFCIGNALSHWDWLPFIFAEFWNMMLFGISHRFFPEFDELCYITIMPGYISLWYIWLGISLGRAKTFGQLGRIISSPVKTSRHSVKTPSGNVPSRGPVPWITLPRILVIFHFHFFFGADTFGSYTFGSYFFIACLGLFTPTKRSLVFSDRVRNAKRFFWERRERSDRRSFCHDAFVPPFFFFLLESTLEVQRCPSVCCSLSVRTRWSPFEKWQMVVTL